MPSTPCRPAHSRPGPTELGATTLGTVAVYALLAGVFVLDALTSLVTVPLLYVPVILLAYFASGGRQLVVTTGAAVLLIVVGAFVSPAPDMSTVTVAGNRVICVLAALASGWFGASVHLARRRLERANRSLQEAQRRVAVRTRLLEIAGEVGRLGGWSLDATTGRALWSDEAARIHGTEPGEEHTLEEVLDYTVPEDRDRMREAVLSCIRSGEPFEEEVQIVRRSDGAVRWVHAVGRAERGADGEVTVVHGAVQDITERIDAQVEAASHRRQLQMLGDSMPFIIWTATAGGHIDYVSEEAWRYAGSPSATVLGEAWLGFVHAEDRDRALDDWHASVASSQPYVTEFRARRRDGAFRWHLARAVPERDAHGEVVKWWGSLLDIHDVRTLETEASSLARRLTDTLESIGDAVLALDQEWRVTFVNRHGERLLQHARADLLGRNIWAVFPEARGSVFEREYRRAVEERRSVSFEEPFEPLGIIADITAYPHDGGLTIYFRDVTEQRAMAADLARARMRTARPDA